MTRKTTKRAPRAKPKIPAPSAHEHPQHGDVLLRKVPMPVLTDVGDLATRRGVARADVMREALEAGVKALLRREAVKTLTTCSRCDVELARAGDARAVTDGAGVARILCATCAGPEVPA